MSLYKYYLSVKEGVPARGYWDQTLLDRLFIDFVDVPSLKDVSHALVIIAGAYQFDVVDKINKELSKLDSCVVIISSDEENKFPVNEIDHPNCKVYMMYPNGMAEGFPIGITPHTDYLSWLEKDLDVFYSGQVNHEDRKLMANKLSYLPETLNKYLHYSEGFSLGLERGVYMNFMSMAKVAPAPKGNISYDSFRLYEALEAGAVPIAQNPEFWHNLFGDFPFPAIDSHEQWSGYIQDTLNKFPYINAECQAWWTRQKFNLRHKIKGFFEDEMMSFIIPVSPIKSHPDISILVETYKSIRFHFPTAPIYITFDGVRKEQRSKKLDYINHIRHFLFETRQDSNIYPVIFDEHKHQIGMARYIMDYINTPLICYVEQDCPLVTDEPIDWASIADFIFSGYSNVVRFHFEAFIPKEHEHLMLGVENEFMRTIQWSQRPAVYSTAYFRRILKDCFKPNAKCFIEDKMHGVIIEDYHKDGIQGWLQHRIHIYHPDGNIKRSLHTDGRAGEAKFDERQIF
jgi:hypothetical protein